MIVMEPGKNYSFPGDLAVLESKKFPSFMMGGIPGVNGSVISNTMMPTSSKKNPIKKYQTAKGPILNTTTEKRLSPEIMSRFYVSNPGMEGFTPPSLLSLLGVNKEEGTLDARLFKSGKIGKIDISSTARPLNIGQTNKDFFIKPVSVGAGLNLGVLGNIEYNADINKKTNLKEALLPSNFVYSNRFGDKNFGGSVMINPKVAGKAELNLGRDLGIKYDTKKDQKGKVNTVSGSFNPGGPFSMQYYQQYRPEEKKNNIISQKVSGNITTAGFDASAYRNVSKKEGKTYGASFDKTSGPITYGGSADYGSSGLKDLRAQLAAEGLFNLNYSKTKEGSEYSKSLGATIGTEGPVSLDFSQDYNPDNSIMNQRVQGNLKTDKLNASVYRNVSQDEGKTYGGSFAKTQGASTYGASADYDPRGLVNLKGNLSAEDFLNLNYSKERKGKEYQRSLGATLNVSKPFSLSYTSTKGPEGNQTEVGGKLNLKNTQASLTKRIGEGSESYKADVSQKVGPVTLTASGNTQGKKVQDYNVGANLNLFGPTRTKPNRGTLSISGNFGRKTDDKGSLGKAKFTPTVGYKASFKKGGQHGGLDRWFAEKWVDVKTGKPCGRQEGESRAGYPACRPSKRISSKTPKTSSEMSSQEKAKFKATKTSSQRIPYNHKRR
jgi:hypothetical protein